MSFGLIGAGRWGTNFISTLSAMEGAKLSVVASRNPETGKRVPANCEVVDDWRAVFRMQHLDGLILATPPATHFEIASACVESGLPVMVEKPLTLSSDQARKLRDLSIRSGTLIMVDHTHLFSSAFETLKTQVSLLQGPLRIRSVGGNQGPFRQDVNALWDYGPHDISMCLDIFCDDQPRIRDARYLVSPETTGEQGMTISVQLDFTSGGCADLTFGNLMPVKQRIFEIRGRNGALLYDDLAEDKLVEQDKNGSWHTVDISSSLPLTRAVSAFRDAIASGDRQHPSLSLGVRVVETLNQIETAL